jgi:hypothetical protein
MNLFGGGSFNMDNAYLEEFSEGAGKVKSTYFSRLPETRV